MSVASFMDDPLRSKITEEEKSYQTNLSELINGNRKSERETICSFFKANSLHRPLMLSNVSLSAWKKRNKAAIKISKPWSEILQHLFNELMFFCNLKFNV